MGQPLNLTIGLEVHIRLKTAAKIFCACSSQPHGQPNVHTCPVCLGLPGSLPVFNREVLSPALKLALALGCEIPSWSEFSRKNYFYPDLPRNYQITQNEHPLARGGRLEGVALERLHLEEDAGRSRHRNDGLAAVDMNRAGIPLVEIVTRPELKSGREARQWLTRLRQLVRHLAVSDGDMEKGSLRCDANLGIGLGHRQAGPWVEIKNLNSLRFVEQALDHEAKRLRRDLAENRPLIRQTRGWNPRTKDSYLMRVKEETADYLFFPEPDILPVHVPAGFLAKLSRQLPEMPWAMEHRFMTDLGIRQADAVTLCRSRALASYFEKTVGELIRKGHAPKKAGPEVAKWVLTNVLGSLLGSDEDLSAAFLGPQGLGQLLDPLLKGRACRSQILNVFALAWGGEDPAVLLQAEATEKRDPGHLEKLVEEVLAENPEHCRRYRQGKKNLLNYFLGEIFKRSGKGMDPSELRLLILMKLEEER